MPTPDYMHAIEGDSPSQKRSSGNPFLWLSVIAFLGVLSSAIAGVGLSLYLLSTSAVYTPQYSLDCLDKFDATMIQPDQLKSCLVK